MTIQSLKIQREKLREPIFIVACGRSGTTLLINILGKHKNIYSIPWETFFFRDIKPKVYTLCNKFEREKDFDNLTLSILTIFLYYPEAKIITIFRDPRATYCSWKYSDFFKNSFVRDILVFILVWITAHKTSKKLLKRIPTQFYSLRYEALINRPEIEIKNLCAFLDEEFDEAMSDTSVIHSSFKHGISYEGFSKESMGRWKKLLNEGEILLIELLTKKHRNELNYPDSEVKITLLNIVKIFFVVIKAFFQAVFIVLNKLIFKYRFYIDQTIYEFQGLLKRFNS
ncbi:MAG: sulfotransferase [Candidatus Melainabacteria bacterium]|nr:sulfotransferase [Candidatus Melainabacteria bacterium]